MPRLERYGPYLHELEADGIRYMPAVFSSYGCRHPDLSKMLREVAHRVVRCHGLLEHKSLQAKWVRDLTATVWMRAASMVQACLNHTKQAQDMLRREQEEMEEEAEDEGDAMGFAAPGAAEVAPH